MERFQFFHIKCVLGCWEGLGQQPRWPWRLTPHFLSDDTIFALFFAHVFADFMCRAVPAVYMMCEVFNRFFIYINQGKIRFGFWLYFKHLHIFELRTFEYVNWIVLSYILLILESFTINQVTWSQFELTNWRWWFNSMIVQQNRKRIFNAML